MPPTASDRPGSAARCGLRQSGFRHSGTGSYSLARRAMCWRRAGSRNRAARAAPASRIAAASPIRPAIAPGSASRGDGVAAHRPPNCAGSRAISWPRRRSTRCRSRSDRARYSAPRPPALPGRRRSAGGHALSRSGRFPGLARQQTLPARDRRYARPNSPGQVFSRRWSVWLTLWITKPSLPKSISLIAHGLCLICQ